MPADLLRLRVEGEHTRFSIPLQPSWRCFITEIDGASSSRVEGDGQIQVFMDVHCQIGVCKPWFEVNGSVQTAKQGEWMVFPRWLGAIFRWLLRSQKSLKGGGSPRCIVDVAHRDEHRLINMQAETIGGAHQEAVVTNVVGSSRAAEGAGGGVQLQPGGDGLFWIHWNQ